MRRHGVLLAAALILFGAAALAQDRSRPPDEARGGSPATGTYLTLKERLSDKASDEQRVNNCGVSPERRGSKPRPEGCKSAAAGRSPGPSR
jgi:hypothetical protein